MALSVPATLLLLAAASAWAQQSSVGTGQSDNAAGQPDRGSVSGAVTYEDGRIVVEQQSTRIPLAKSWLASRLKARRTRPATSK
jgi:hypothetical protein